MDTGGKKKDNRNGRVGKTVGFLYVCTVYSFKKRNEKKKKGNTFGIIGQRGTNTFELYSS